MTCASGCTVCDARGKLEHVVTAADSGSVPIELTELKTKNGHPALRVNFEGDVTPNEARGFMAKATRGGQYFGYGHLVVGNIAGLSADVRKVLTSEKTKPTNPPPVAIVLLSAMTRMVASLAMRLTENVNTEDFKNEADAKPWLDERMDVFIAKGGSDTA